MIPSTKYQLLPIDDILSPREKMKTTYLSVGEVLNILQQERDDHLLSQARSLSTRRVLLCCSLSFGCFAAIAFLLSGGCLYLNFTDQKHSSGLKTAIFGLSISYGLATFFSISCLIASCINLRIPCPKKYSSLANSSEINRINGIISRNNLLNKEGHLPCGSELLSECEGYLGKNQWQRLDFTQLKQLSENQIGLFKRLYLDNCISAELRRIWDLLETIKNEDLPDSKINEILKDPVIQRHIKDEPEFSKTVRELIPIK